MYAHLLDHIDLMQIQSPEDLDNTLELVLELNAGRDDAESCSARDKLANMFGTQADVFASYIGFEFSNDIAMARLQLIQMSYAHCLSILANKSKHDDALVDDELRQAIAVCCGFQFETLGWSDNSTAAFAVDFCQEVRCIDLGEFLMRAPEERYVENLAFLRSICALPSGQFLAYAIADARLGLPGLRSKKVLGSRCDENRNNLQMAVFCSVIVDVLSEAMSVAHVPVEFQDISIAGIPAYSTCISEFFACVGLLPECAAKGVEHYGVYRLRQSVSALGLQDVFLAPFAYQEHEDSDLMTQWRYIGTLTDAQVVAPVLSSSTYYTTRLGVSEDVDQLIQPFVLADQNEARLGYQKLLLGSVVMSVLVRLADCGHIWGAAPQGKCAAKFWSRNADGCNVIKVGGHVLEFRRDTRLGMTLGVAADTAQLLSYLDPAEELEHIGAASVLDILNGPLQDDVRYDVGLAAALVGAELLDAATLSDVMRFIAACVCEAEDFDPQNAIRRLAKSHVFHGRCASLWQAFRNQLRDSTAGLSAELPDRVNFLGEDTGQPCAGTLACQSVLDGDGANRSHDPDRDLYALLTDIGSVPQAPVALPSRFVAGYFMSNSAYWSFAKRRGQIVKKHLLQLLAERPVLAALLRDQEHNELRTQLVAYVVACADDTARGLTGLSMQNDANEAAVAASGLMPAV